MAIVLPLMWKQLSTRSKRFLGISLVASLFVWMTVIFSLAKNHLMDEGFLESGKCPIYYGKKMCHPLLIGDVQLTGFSRIRSLDIFNAQNVYFGDYSGLKVVLKRLADDNQLAAFDAGICAAGGQGKGCEITSANFASKYLRALRNADLELAHLEGLSDFTTCPSKRLLARIQEKFQERTEPGRRMLFRDKVMLLTTLKINAESLLLQTFPALEGWPFPQYVGACGRFVVVGNGGKRLADYFHAPFHIRAELSYQVFKIADQLTNNRDGYALYWTDAKLENLAVDSEGRVTIIDAENVLVVDKLEIAKARSRGWDDLHESRYDQCEPSPGCFERYELCKHLDSDHNYYVVCRNLFSHASKGVPGIAGGFLHDMPDYANHDYQLQYLLNECARPRREKGRIHVKDKLLSTLNTLRIESLERGGIRRPIK